MDSQNLVSLPVPSQELVQPSFDEELGYKSEPLSLESMSGLDSPSSPFGTCDTPNQTESAVLIFKIPPWEELLGPDEDCVSQGIDAHALGRTAVKEERPLATFRLEEASRNASIHKQPGHGTDHSPRCGADAPISLMRRRKFLTWAQKRDFCEAHKYIDSVKAAENQWAIREYPGIDWRTLNARIKKKLPALRHILGGAVPSYYREDLGCSVVARVNPIFRGMG